MPTTNNPLKIGLVLDDGLDKPDGVQQYIFAIGGWLSTRGHDVRYLVGETTRSDLSGVYSMSKNVTWRFNGNSGTMPLPARRSNIRQILYKENFDILHVQVPYSPFMAHKVIKNAPPETAVIGSFHIAPNSAIVRHATRALGIWLSSSLRRFDRMLSVSSAASDFALQTFRVKSDISPNVIDYRRFHEALPFPKYNDDVPTVLFLGRLVPRKGCQKLLEAVVLLSKSSEHTFRVLICGRGPLEASLKQYAEAHGLNELVTFVGFVSEADKPRYYASADVAVFPSSGGESFGIVLLEAMASGKAAVLAGDNPGYRSVLYSKPELLFDPNDSEVLSNKISVLLHDGQLRKSHAAWGEAHTKQFDVQTVGVELETIYLDALQKRRNQ